MVISSVHNSGLINLNDSLTLFCVGRTVLTVTAGGNTMGYSAIQKNLTTRYPPPPCRYVYLFEIV